MHLKTFLEFARSQCGIILYDYQAEIADALMRSIIIERENVYIKVARQAGKTEVLTLLLKYLMLMYREMAGVPLMVAVASPNGEQAKTDIDRIKKDIVPLCESWGIEDREFNAHTVRAYMRDVLMCEMYRFSLAPTTRNESKTLNVLAIEEMHGIDDEKRGNELDPMLVSTGGVTWGFGVGCTRQCDFKRACDGHIAGARVMVFDVDRVIADRRRRHDETGDPSHLLYERTFHAELAIKGKMNPQIRRNYYLEDTVEVGNFISRGRLLSCSFAAEMSKERLFLGIDWARVSDSTWACVVNDANKVVDWMKYPHVRYEEQIELLLRDLKERGYFDRICGVCGDSTGLGDFPMEYLQEHTSLPISEDSKVAFTLQSKNEMYTNFDDVLFRDEGDPIRFGYPASHELAEEFEGEMCALVREYRGGGELLSPHHPDTPGARDDAADATALALLAAKNPDRPQVQWL